MEQFPTLPRCGHDDVATDHQTVEQALATAAVSQ
jgi:hypothetical protein